MSPSHELSVILPRRAISVVEDLIANRIDSLQLIDREDYATLSILEDARRRLSAASRDPGTPFI